MKKSTFENISLQNLASAPKKEDWIDIHPDFSKDKQYKWSWKETIDISYQEAKRGIDAGFEPKDHREISKMNKP